MTKQEYINNIKLELTGNVLHLELKDEVLGNVVDKSLNEIQRYIDSPKAITIPFARCIDLTGFNCSAVVNVYRAKGYMWDSDASNIIGGQIDPFQVQMWQVFSNNGSMYKLQDYIYNYSAYNTLLQMRSTTSTDMAFKTIDDKLYINCEMDDPTMITIEYIPIFKDVEEVKSPYWQDILKKMSVAFTKVILGRVRSRYVQSNALWTQDGDSLLNEGNKELEDLREILRNNSVEFYPVD